MPNPFIQPITILGQTKGRGPSIQFGMYQADRLFHTLVIGQTGTGKSTLLLNMMRQDVEASCSYSRILWDVRQLDSHIEDLPGGSGDELANPFDD